MTILELHIEHFGKLKDRRIPFRPGTNVITGNNETGKSTIAAFIKAVLYGLSDGDEEYRHFFPRAYEGRFGGSIKLEDHGTFYEIRRELSGADKTFTIRNLSTGELYGDPETRLAILTGGIDRESFEESGFISTESFPADAFRYRPSKEKAEKAAHEKEVRADFLKAKEILKTRREAFVRETDDRLEAQKYRAEEEAKALGERLAELERTIPASEAALSSEKGRLAVDTADTEDRNRKREEGFREEVRKVEEEIEAYREKLRKSATTTFSLGIVFLVLGLLTGSAAFVYIRFFGIGNQLPDHRTYLIGSAIAGAAGLIFLIGIILMIVGGVKRKKIEEKVNARDDLIEELGEKETALQDYLGRRSELDDRVENESARKKSIADLKNRIEAWTGEQAKKKERAETLKQELETLTRAEERDRAARAEIRAIDLAIATFDRVGDLDRNLDYDEFSENATACYNGLLPERPAKIELTDGVLYAEFPDSGKYLLSQLSTGTMHEVLIAARLARLKELDPEKHLPLILDDVFTNFDETRLNAAMEYLRSTGRQSVLFSCQLRGAIGGK